MTTHNHGRVSPFGHPRINAHQATPRGLTQPITSFIGLAYPGIHRAPKKQKTQTFHAQTTKNTKNKNHKKEKQTTTTNIVVAINYYRIRVHYTVLTQHTTPTNNTHQPTVSDLAYQIRGDSIEQQPCCSRHPTACHKNKTNQNTNTFAETPKKSPRFASSTSKPPHASRVRDLFHLKTKTATTSRLNQTQNNDEKLVTNQALTSTHPATKQKINYILLRKEVIQPHLPVRLPCYDFVPIANPTFDHSPHQNGG